MIWRFSDGTTVELGGNVEGATILAQQLRERLKQRRISVDIWPPPDGAVDLDTSDPALLDAWLQQELHERKRIGLRFTLTRPEGIPPLPPPPWAGQPHEPGVQY